MQKRHLLILLFAGLALCLFLFAPALASASSVSGTAWVDKTSDGQYEKENGLNGVQITLENRQGAVATALTGKDGAYLFDGLSDGEYRLTVELPGGFVPTIPGLGSALLPAQSGKSATAWFVLAGDETLNLGATKSSIYVGFVAFVDENANGGRMLSEEALKGVHVDIVYTQDGTDYTIASGETGKDGALQIRDLTPGTYHAAVTLPEHYIIGPKGAKINTFYNCINASDGAVALSDEFTVTKGSVGMGIGAVKTGNAQGVIWFDADHDGKRGASEAGFESAVVELISDEFSLTRTAKVGSDGSFLFANLQPTTYKYRVTLPDGYMFTLPGGDSQFTDGYSPTQTASVIVTAESTATIQPVGVMEATSLLVTFYEDKNADGVRGSDEPAFSGAKVALFANEKQVASAVSGENGEALIPIARSGAVKVQAILPDGYIFSILGNDNQFAVTGAQAKCELDASLHDAQQTALSAGVITPAAIRGFLYADENNNGERESSESPMPGFTVQAADAQGNIVAQAVTDENGEYQLSPLSAQAHTVRFLLADPYIASPAGSTNDITVQNPDYGETESYPLLPGQTLENVDGGVFKAGVVSGSVMLTLDNLATTDGGLQGVIVTLIDANGQEYADYTTAVTDENGSFYIKGILPGTYSVRYTLPNDALFSGTDETSILSESFVSSMGSENKLNTVGAMKTATISGTVMHQGQPLAAQVTAVSKASGESKSVSVSAEGSFTLSLLRPGDYDVSVELPEGYVFAYDTALVPAKAQNVSSASVSLAMAQVVSDAFITAASPAVLSGVLYYDENNSGARDSDETLIDNHPIKLLSGDHTEIAEFSTDPNGAFTTPRLIPGDYMLAVSLNDDCILVNQNAEKAENGVWYLPFSVADAEYAENFDAGVLRFSSIAGSLWSMDGSTDGLNGLTVSLFAASSPDQAIATATTGQNGAYQFDHLYPNDYYLTCTLPDEHMFARTADTHTRNSIILADTESGKQGRSEEFYLMMGEEKTGADIGIGAKGEIGDFAWLDENKNGMQDIGEKGVPGIQIDLYQYGEPVASATTDSYGHYFFDNLYPGTYTMKVTMHAELKATKHQEEFPLVNSIMPDDSTDMTVTIDGIVVPSGERDLSLDLGFALRKDGKYPSVMNDLPTTDWSFGGTKNQ